MDTPNEIKSQTSQASSGDGPTSVPPTISGEEKVSEYERQLRVFREELAALEKNRLVLTKNIDKEFAAVGELKKTLTPILEAERAVIVTLQEVNQKEREANDTETRRKYEQERWQHIGTWYAIEQKKWELRKSYKHNKNHLREIKRLTSTLRQKR